MGFITDTKTIPEIIATLAAELAATPDFVIHDDQVNGGYCLHYAKNNAYLTIQLIQSVYHGSQYGGGIAFVVSSGWNAETHLPEGTIQRGMAQLYSYSGTVPMAVFADDRRYPYSFWIDKFGIVGNIYNPYSDYTSCGAMIALEFMPETWKEYSDQYTGIFLWTYRNRTYTAPSYGPNIANYYYYHLRPYILSTYTSIVETSAYKNAFRSLGNSKVYFEFPYYHNETARWDSPVAQTRRWFEVNKATGIAVNDVVSWLDPDGVTVRKYLIVECGSAGTTTSQYFAIPYSNPVNYG